MELDLFLEAQDYAKDKEDDARKIGNRNERFYWQGVKDGLRKCYAICTNDPTWDAMGGGSSLRATIREWEDTA